MNSGLVHRPDWKEMRRFRALELKIEDCIHEEIAEALGVMKAAVSKWMKAMREGGEVEASIAPKSPRNLCPANGRSGSIEEFPAYAPDLNPNEGVWQHLKHFELRNLCCVDLDHLEVELTLAIRRMRRSPDLIRSFFAEAELDP